ncbi:hypothetical protein ABG067_003128 [Albugo candida]
MRADSKRITRPEFNSTDAHNCAIEKENAHPIADGNQTKCNTDIHIKGMEQSVRKRKGKFANSKFVNARKRHHRDNDTDAFCVAHGNKRKRDDETNITVVNKTVDRAVTNTVKVQSKTSVLKTTAKKQKISVWLRGRTAADEDEWIENQKSIVLEWANSVLLTSLKGENGCLKNGEEIGACDPFTSLRKLGMEASWLYKGKKLLQRAEIQAVKSKLSKEIESGRLCIRKDRPVYVDVGLQEELFGLLNAYDPLWLALGLCTVLEPVIPQTTRFSLLGRIQKLKRNNDSQTHPTRLPAILRSLVLKHLIHDEKVAYNHRHVCKLKAPFTQSDGKSPRARWDGEEYFEELSNVMALKFLMLVLFLDQAQSSNSDAFTQFPCLFRSNSTHTSVVKQSQTIINEFCRLFLSNEGRIDRHLETLGFKLSYTQKPFDEIDPSIHDIGEDLRDGVRLAKLLEALTTSNRHKEKKLSEYLRIPTISRLQKVHNIQVCVYYLQEIIGFPALIESKDECNTFAPIRAKEQIRETEHLVKNLVDGSIRQRTKLGVELLWKLMSWFECEALVDVTMLKREIQQVQANMSTEAKKFFLESCAKGESDTLSGILLEWSRSVCANYSIVLRDLQLEDDALCALIHYYHPMLISRSAVENPSKELEKALQRISVWLRGRTAADEDEWIENQKSIVLEWANSVLLTSLKGENGCLKNGEEIGACDPFTSLRKLGMEASWLYKGKKLLQRAEIQAVKSKLSKEIESGRLCIRKDRPVYVDVGLQEELFGLLNAYDPLWLALGLCTVLEPVIPQTTRFSLLGRIQKLKRNNDSQTHPTRLPAILRSLVLKHLIHDEKVAYNHRHVCKLKAPFTQSDGKSPRARWDGEEYFEELSNVMALKFLMLVLFLDQAQSSNSDAFTQFPCLFRSNSTHTSVVKQSQTIINEFCRLFLSNEGRIDRHLETLGFKLSYTQKPFDEIDPSIHDIGEDLRDGVRLAKLLEALTTSNRHKEKKLSEYLRIPTISRLQKVHNIQVCVYYLQEIIGFPALIESKDECNTFAPIRAKEQIRETEHLVKNLVDGSIRQRTKLGVELLWKLMSWFECEALVDVTMLKREIQQVQANMSTEAKKFFLESCAKGESDTLSGILLEWSRSVCANYSIVLRDLQLEDDALCALIHYYHPMLISRSAVENPSKELEKALQRVGTLPAQMHKFFRKNDFRLSITFVAPSGCGEDSEMVEEAMGGSDPMQFSRINDTKTVAKVVQAKNSMEFRRIEDSKTVEKAL